MSDIVLEPEVQETDEREDAIAESLSELRHSPEAETGEPIVEQEEPVDEVASTDAEVPGDEAPEPHVEQEPSPAPESEEDRELRWARTIAKELQENPELGDALVALKQGRATLIDKQIIEAAQQQIQAQQQETQSADDEDSFWSNPYEFIKRERVERDKDRALIQELMAGRQQEQRVRYQAEVQANQQLAESAGAEWQAAHPNLSEEQLANVIARADENHLVATYFRKHGDKNRALKDGLEAALRIEYPELIASKAKDEAIREANRKRRAGQAAASPRPASRTPEERPTPRNSAERLNLAADFLREMREAQQ